MKLLVVEGQDPTFPSFNPALLFIFTAMLAHTKFQDAGTIISRYSNEGILNLATQFYKTNWRIILQKILPVCKKKSTRRKWRRRKKLNSQLKTFCVTRICNFMELLGGKKFGLIFYTKIIWWLFIGNKNVLRLWWNCIFGAKRFGTYLDQLLWNLNDVSFQSMQYLYL